MTKIQINKTEQREILRLIDKKDKLDRKDYKNRLMDILVRGERAEMLLNWLLSGEESFEFEVK